MMFGKSQGEWKVGLFVFCGLVLLFFFVLRVGDIQNSFSTYPVDIMFDFVNGVKVGAPVRFAGVDIGEVKNIEFLYQEETARIRMGVSIRKGVRIPADSSVWINTLGLLGEKYVEVMPGKNFKEFIQPGARIKGNNPVAMQEFGEMAKELVQKLDNGLAQFQNFTENMNSGLSRILEGEGTLGKLMYDDRLYDELNGLVADIRKHPWKLFWKGRER